MHRTIKEVIVIGRTFINEEHLKEMEENWGIVEADKQGGHLQSLMGDMKKDRDWCYIWGGLCSLAIFQNAEGCGIS